MSGGAATGNSTPRRGPRLSPDALLFGSVPLMGWRDLCSRGSSPLAQACVCVCGQRTGTTGGRKVVSRTAGGNWLVKLNG